MFRITPGRGLDGFNALVASVQTGFGPFVAVYLASEAWTQRDIGQALSIGTLAAMISQIPGGAAVDAIDNKRAAALVSCLAVALSALLLAVWPGYLSVVASEVLHGFASCMLGPGDRGGELAAGGACRVRRAVGAQRPLRGDRQRRGGGG